MAQSAGQQAWHRGGEIDEPRGWFEQSVVGGIFQQIQRQSQTLGVGAAAAHGWGDVANLGRNNPQPLGMEGAAERQSGQGVAEPTGFDDARLEASAIQSEPQA